MRTVRNLTAAAIVATAAFTVAPSSASAEERVCRGSLGRVSVDDLRVPQNATCNLDQTQIRGNVVVERGATLSARTIRVGGNVQAEGAAQVNLGALSDIGGSVQVEQGGGSVVRQTRVRGDIQFDQNRREVRSESNTVGGNIQVMQNRGGAHVSGNRVDGNLQCKENAPAPRGYDNTVRGNMEDQCRNLVK